MLNEKDLMNNEVINLAVVSLIKILVPSTILAETIKAAGKFSEMNGRRNFNRVSAVMLPGTF